MEEKMEEEMEEVIQKKVNEVLTKVYSCIDRRTIILKKGRFYGELEDGQKILIDRDVLISYIKAVIELIEENQVYKSGMISLLYSIDQNIFKIALSNTNLLKDYLDLVNDCKRALQYQIYNEQEEAKQSVGFARNEIKNRKVSIDEYILQLFDDGVITQKGITDIELLRTMNSSQLVNLCVERKIPIDLLLSQRGFKPLNNSEILQLAESGFFYKLSQIELSKLKENGFINARGIIELLNTEYMFRNDGLVLLGGIDEIATQYIRLVRRRNRRDANMYFSVFTLQEVLDLYVKGKFGKEELNKAKFEKEDILNLDEREFLIVAQRGLPAGITLTSDELIEMYGNKFSGKTLVELANLGYVDKEKILDLTDVADVEKSKQIKLEDLTKLYTTKTVSNLIKNNKIDAIFIERLNQSVLSNFDEEQFEQYVTNLIKNCKTKLDKDSFTKVMISMVEETTFPREYFKNLDISQNALMDMFLEENISEDKIIEYFNEGIFTVKELKTIYGDNYGKIIELVKQGKLDKMVITIIPKESLQESLLLNELSVEDIFELYSKYGKISAEELGEMFTEYENFSDCRVTILDLINSNFESSKLRELFIHDILTHSDMMELKERGIITEEQLEEISRIDRDRIYKEIFGAELVSEAEDLESDKNEREKGKKGDKKTDKNEAMMSAKKRRDFFTSLGRCDFRTIEARDTQGREAPFGSYELVGFPEYGVVIFENFNKMNNATYIMTLQELKSYVKREGRQSIVFKKSKTTLRKEADRGKAIHFRNHTANWGHNVIESMKALSKVAKSKIGVKKQTELAEMIRSESIRLKLKKLGGADNPLLRKLVEKERRCCKKAS